ncbi:hypothetical protein [Methylovulum psychrotolerans]|uniref:Uncharacterized protein n=1 Tax=Methylovulum psychrotolerans TaxID=1704499 RepID=A0A2S5CJK6_9GAMM|nr:hypothetical protein [Methylovulum psychrotolerans]POZ50998.1 hypothetical protein AADEFJLK_02952 [Methylovulum psychrotolerans]
MATNSTLLVTTDYIQSDTQTPDTDTTITSTPTDTSDPVAPATNDTANQDALNGITATTSDETSLDSTKDNNPANTGYIIPSDVYLFDGGQIDTSGTTPTDTTGDTVSTTDDGGDNGGGQTDTSGDIVLVHATYEYNIYGTRYDPENYDDGYGTALVVEPISSSLHVVISPETNIHLIALTTTTADGLVV